MIKTDICDLLQIEYPILQGGMAWLGTAELAAAVSEAGGLGPVSYTHLFVVDPRFAELRALLDEKDDRLS